MKQLWTPDNQVILLWNFVLIVWARAKLLYYNETKLALDEKASLRIIFIMPNTGRIGSSRTFTWHQAFKSLWNSNYSTLVKATTKQQSRIHFSQLNSKHLRNEDNGWWSSKGFLWEKTSHKNFLWILCRKVFILKIFQHFKQLV